MYLFMEITNSTKNGLIVVDESIFKKYYIVVELINSLFFCSILLRLLLLSQI